VLIARKKQPRIVRLLRVPSAMRHITQTAGKLTEAVQKRVANSAPPKVDLAVPISQ